MRLKSTDRALCIRVPEELYEAAQAFAAERALSLADLTRLALSNSIGWKPLGANSSRRESAAKKRQ